ncbi:MAG: Na+/H+ antiporter subunit E [Phycisphaerales bacterium]
MGAFLLNVLLACVWTISIGPFAPMNFVIGFVLAYFALALAWGRHRDAHAYFGKSMRVIGYALFFLRELVVANVRVVGLVLGPKDRMRPAIIRVPIEPMSDTALTILANSVTLTPGTLTLDISDDRSTMFVHCLHAENAEAVREEIKQGFERRLLEIFA